MPTKVQTKTTSPTKIFITTCLALGITAIAYSFIISLSTTSQPTAVCQGLLGDLNKNNTLDNEDLTMLQNFYTQGGFDLCGDLNANGFIEPIDISMFQTAKQKQDALITDSNRSPLTAPVTTFQLYKNINQNFTQDSVYPLGGSNPIYSFSIDADIYLPGADSLVRVILTDKNGNEYLIYESFPLITGTTNGHAIISKACEETCVLKDLIPISLKIQIINAGIDMKSTYATTQISNLTTNVTQMGIMAYAQKLKTAQDQSKIDQLNSKNLGWTAGETTISKLSYADKKGLFLSGSLPNLQGFEYYTGGIFGCGTINPALLDISFDWRNRHGENWITPIKDQGACGSCWAFSAIGTAEAAINLYYNQHLNIDLSEKDSLCRHPGSCANGGYSSWTLGELKTTGLVDETCLPYSIPENNKCTKCTDNQSRLWKAPYILIGVSPDYNLLKNALEINGPISLQIKPLWHYMTLVGYKGAKAGNFLIWTFKNSWGNFWGENGYVNMCAEQSSLGTAEYVKTPSFTANPNQYKITCVDKDKDNFCNWGISATKPTTCPANCLAAKDYNDCNSDVGSSPSYITTCKYCSGETPADATLCPGDTTGLQQITPNIVVNSCTLSQKCEYTCNQNYYISGNSCVTYACQGAIPANSLLCPSDTTGLTQNTPITLVNNCTATKKCEYICNKSTFLQNNACVTSHWGPPVPPVPSR